MNLRHAIYFLAAFCKRSFWIPNNLAWIASFSLLELQAQGQRSPPRSRCGWINSIVRWLACFARGGAGEPPFSQLKRWNESTNRSISQGMATHNILQHHPWHFGREIVAPHFTSLPSWRKSMLWMLLDICLKTFPGRSCVSSGLHADLELYLAKLTSSTSDDRMNRVLWWRFRRKNM